MQTPKSKSQEPIAPVKEPKQAPAERDPAPNEPAKRDPVEPEATVQAADGKIPVTPQGP